MPEALRPYQEAGAKWLASKSAAILGDEMTLGKTPQAIVAADAIDARRIVVVCPAVIRPQWAREFEKFSSRAGLRNRVIESAKNLSLEDADIVIVSYDLVSRKRVLEALISWKPDLLICDEAHFIRNKGALRTQAILGSDCTGKNGLAGASKATWFLSGTLTPNSVLDYWPFMRFTRAFTNHELAFRRQFTVGYEGSFGYVVTRNKNIPDLRRRLANVMLRRTRNEVLPDLPKVQVVNFPIEGAESPIAGDFILREVPELDTFLMEELEHFERTGRWRHPINVSAARRKIGMMKVLPMCQLIDEELKGNAGVKVLVFGIHAIGLKFVRAYLAHHGAKLIFGGTDPRRRQQFIDEFQTSPKCRVMVGQINALGAGVNLTAANSVWLFEPSWLPDENIQAIMRGSVRAGLPEIARLVSLAGTVDDKVNAKLAARAAQIDEIRS